MNIVWKATGRDALYDYVLDGGSAVVWIELDEARFILAQSNVGAGPVDDANWAGDEATIDIIIVLNDREVRRCVNAVKVIEENSLGELGPVAVKDRINVDWTSKDWATKVPEGKGRRAERSFGYAFGKYIITEMFPTYVPPTWLSPLVCTFFSLSEKVPCIMRPSLVTNRSAIVPRASARTAKALMMNMVRNRMVDKVGEKTARGKKQFY